MYNNSQKDCEEIIKLYQKDTSNSQRKIGDLDYKNNNVFVISNDLGITMPEGIGIVKGTILADNNSTYLINTEQQHVGGGLCKADEFKNTCDYYDETLPNIGILRIWRENKSNVFAINPQDISVNGKFLNRLIITKLTPNVYFTQSEIEFWKNALSEIISLK